MSAPGSRFLHLVDFGNHRSSRSPFAGMYAVTPDEYFHKHGSGINLARALDMVRVFGDAGLAAGLALYYWFREFHDEPIAEYWSVRYSEDELFLKAALVFGPA